MTAERDEEPPCDGGGSGGRARAMAGGAALFAYGSTTARKARSPTLRFAGEYR